MARKEALLRLHAHLQERRRELLRSIHDDLLHLQKERSSRGGADEADAATDAMTTEMTTQLAQMEYRELAQIDRALARLLNGVYGSCEICGKKIPVARLNALPYTTMCIECQRESEDNPDFGAGDAGNWQKVFEAENSTRDAPVNLADLEYKLS